jgi:hypothetical protein
MKNHSRIYLLSFFVLLLFSTSCSLKDSICKDGQGDVISQERAIPRFTAVESRGSFTVNIFQDSSIKTQSVTISAQENIIELIQTTISGQSLIIDTDECYTTNEEVTITIRTPALSQIVLIGSGDIILQDTVRKSEIEFIVDGSGTISTTPSFPIIASTNCTVRLKGSGAMELDFKTTAIVNTSIDGSGTIILRGEAAKNNLNISGSGNIKAFNLPVLTSTAEVIGSGIIELTATDTRTPSTATVNARLSGSGQILIKGNATIKSNISGSGKIERVD